MKKVLVVSKGVFHPTVMCKRQLHRAINGFGNIKPEFRNSLNINGITLSGYDAVVFYFHEKKMNSSFISLLSEYVDKGGLLLCIHGALASFKTYPDYAKLLGSRFTGHENIRRMDVTGILNFTITDEPYEFELSGDCEVLLENKGLPVCWIKKSGQGRVVGFVPGHRLETIQNESVKNMIEYILNEL